MARRANGEGSITTTIRNGKTYYRGSVTIGINNKGKAIRKTFGSFKKSVVIDKMNDAKYESKNNILSNSDVTFGELYKYWIDEFKRIEVGKNSFIKYLTTYELRIDPYPISIKKASQITLNDLQIFFNSLQEKFSPTTIKEIYMHINTCFNFAVIQGIVFKNFCPGVALPKIKKEKKINVFSKQEQDLILENLDLRNIIDTIIYFTFFTGLRLGEVLGLKWSNISGNILLIKEQYGREVEIKDNKKIVVRKFKELKTNESEREIPLTNKVIKLLDDLPKISDIIFCDDKGGPIEHKRPQRRIEYLCKSLSIPHRSFHSIRHSYATRLFEMGVPIKTVQTLLGHADVNTTMNIYTHVMQDKKLEVLDLLNKL